MSFTARVRTSGKLFQATADLGPLNKFFHDAAKLKDDTCYFGHLFDDARPVGPFWEFTTAKSAISRGQELEESSESLRFGG